MSLLLLIGSSQFVARQPIPLTFFPLLGLTSHSDSPFSILTIHVLICLRTVDPIRLCAPCGQGLGCQGQAQRHSLAQGHLWAVCNPTRHHFNVSPRNRSLLWFCFKGPPRLAEGPKVVQWAFIEWQLKMLTFQTWSFKAKRREKPWFHLLLSSRGGSSFSANPTPCCSHSWQTHWHLHQMKLCCNSSFGKLHGPFPGSGVKCGGGHTFVMSLNHCFLMKWLKEQGRLQLQGS